MHRFPRALFLPALAACALALAACAGVSVPQHLYTLAAPAPADGEALRPPAPGLVIGVGPVELADYLDRGELAVRGPGNEINLLEGHAWAGSLRDEFGAALGEALAGLLPGANVARYPWPSSLDVDYRLAVRVVRFEGGNDGTARLQARWTLRDGAGGVLAMRSSLLVEPVSGPGAADLAAALGRTVQALAREAAQAMAAPPGGHGQ